jgi:hypothetical protein
MKSDEDIIKDLENEIVVLKHQMSEIYEILLLPILMEIPIVSGILLIISFALGKGRC